MAIPHQATMVVLPILPGMNYDRDKDILRARAQLLREAVSASHECVTELIRQRNKRDKLLMRKVAEAYARDFALTYAHKKHRSRKARKASSRRHR